LERARRARTIRGMARPVRGLWTIRRDVRRRHRTWMLSMGLATLGWSAWWIAAILWKTVPALGPDLGVVEWIARVFALAGFAAALLAVRARRAWLLITLLPFLANLSLFFVPFVLETLGALEQARLESSR
jgi:hypothetical protein